MNYLIDEGTVKELERSISRLESMGTILEDLCAPDRDIPDLTSLADLGSLISQQAMMGLDLLAEKEEIQTIPDKPKFQPTTDLVTTKVWFVPETPND